MLLVCSQEFRIKWKNERQARGKKRERERERGREREKEREKSRLKKVFCLKGWNGLKAETVFSWCP